MSFYADYIKERTNDLILECDHGFATYRYINDGKSVYIVDIFIIQAGRKSGAATALAEIICHEAKTKGCTEVLGTVVPSTKNSTASLKVLLGYGMELKSSGQDLIIFKKDL